MSYEVVHDNYWVQEGRKLPLPSSTNRESGTEVRNGAPLSVTERTGSTPVCVLPTVFLPMKCVPQMPPAFSSSLAEVGAGSRPRHLAQRSVGLVSQDNRVHRKNRRQDLRAAEPVFVRMCMCF